MNHAEVRSRMADYLDGGLMMDKRALVDAHLDGCEPCSLNLSELQSTVALLRSLPTPEPPPDLAESVIERIRAGEGRSRWQEISATLASWLTPARLMVPATALAAGAAVVFVGANPLAPSGEAPQVQPTAELAQQGNASTLTSSPARPAATPQPRSRELAVVAPDPRSIRPSAANAAPVVEVASVSQPILRPVPVTNLPSFPSFQPGAARAGAQPVARVQPLANDPATQREQRVALIGREQLLDQRLDLLRRNPAGFAGWLSRLSLAERDLWLNQFAKHAVERGIEDTVFQALRSAEEPRTHSISDQFASALEQLGGASEDGGEPLP